MNKEEKLKLKNIHINTISRQVRRRRKKINLTKKEFDLLEFLARNKNIVINRLTLLEYVWNYKVGVETNTLEVHMAGLRQKLEKGQRYKLIQTIHGVGYKLCDRDQRRRRLI